MYVCITCMYYMYVCINSIERTEPLPRRSPAQVRNRGGPPLSHLLSKREDQAAEPAGRSSQSATNKALTKQPASEDCRFPIFPKNSKTTKHYTKILVLIRFDRKLHILLGPGIGSMSFRLRFDCISGIF